MSYNSVCRVSATARMVLFILACAGAIAVRGVDYDSMYTAETGYVTMTGNDSKDSSGFAGSGKWSDGEPPHPDTNYYVGVNRSFYTPNSKDCNGRKFGGQKLVVAGSIQHTAGSGVTISWGDVEFLPGAIYNFSSVGRIQSGDFFVKGTADNPFKFTVFRGSGSVYWIDQYMNMRSGESGYTVVEQKGRVLQRFSYFGDWSGYCGTFECSTNLHIYLSREGFSSPGTFVVPTDAMLAISSGVQNVTLGSLDVKSGGKVCFDGSATSIFNITDRLVLAPDAIVDSSNVFSRTASPVHTSMVFRLSPKAVAAGLPDLDSISFPFRKSGALGDLPHVVPFMMDDPEIEGGKYIGLRMKEIVKKEKDCTSEVSAFDPKYGNPEEFWSNGNVPESGYDYFAEGVTVFFKGVTPFVFPGDSLTMVGNEYFGIYNTMKDITFNQLSFVGGVKMRPMNYASYILRGVLKVYKTEEQDEPVHVAIHNKLKMEIASNVSGHNDINVYLMQYGKPMSNLGGEFLLSGNNTNWTGRLLVAATNDVYLLPNGELCEVDASHNLTLRISDSRNLGGKLDSIIYDSLTVSNQCRLVIDGTTTFSETTRGWYFPRTAYLYVTNDATVTCLNTLTVGGNLVKEGKGTLCLSSPTAIEGDNASISVTEGVLAAGSADAFKGLAIDVAQGASIGIDLASKVEGFSDRGIDLTDVTLTSDTDKIGISLLGATFDPETSNGPYALFTCSAERLDSIKTLLHVRKPWQGSGMSVSYAERENGDGSVTLCATLKPCKLRITIR